MLYFYSILNCTILFNILSKLKIRSLLAVFYLFILIATSLGCEQVVGERLEISESSFKALRVAHAGGGYKRKTYTNTIEALNKNISNGFTYFELDFLFTTDDRLVCLHDWGQTFKNIFDIKNPRQVSYLEFEDLIDSQTNLKPCTEESLALWMENNPQAFIVIDTKENNSIDVIEYLTTVLPDPFSRLIPQIYSPNNYATTKKMGFENIIWTLYSYGGTNDEVVDWLTKFEGSFAITMPEKRARSGLCKRLKKYGTPTYVHTINSNEDVFLKDLDCTEIYTDFLSP